MDGNNDDRLYATKDRGAGHGTSAVAWIALLIALLALGLAWWAFNRTGEDLTNRIEQQVQETYQGVEQGVQEGAQEVEQGVDQTEDAIDAGPDGVDEDDTDTGAGTGSGMDATEETTPNTNQ